MVIPSNASVSSAVTMGMINVAGGFLVTDRMLEMFKKKPADTGGGKS